MDRNIISQVARGLIDAKYGRYSVPLPSGRYRHFDLTSGYLVGAEINRELIDRGCKPVGRKIGFTNRDTWKEFNLSTPVWAHMYDKTVSYALSGKHEVRLGTMLAPRIEPEVVLKLKDEVLADEGHGAKILQSVEWVSMGFEIVDCHYQGWAFTAADAVADFGLHANLVVGPQVMVEGMDGPLFEEQLKTFRVFLIKDGKTVAEGKGANALGSPLLALKYLADVLRDQPRAVKLCAGEVITTGTLTRLPAISPGESWHIETEGIQFPNLNVVLTD